MPSVEPQLHQLTSQFFQTWLFEELTASARQHLAQRLQLCRFQPGQPLQIPGELPSTLHYIVRGKVRLLGPASADSPTLAIAGKGTLLGWDSLVRRVSSGSARASLNPLDETQPVMTLALPADDFEAIALRSLLPVLEQRVSVLELFDTLSRFLSTLPTAPASFNLPELVQQIDRGGLAIAHHCYPQSVAGAARCQPLGADLNVSQGTGDRLWLVSGGTLISAIGTALDPAQALTYPATSPFPVRLLGIDRQFLLTQGCGEQFAEGWRGGDQGRSRRPHRAARAPEDAAGSVAPREFPLLPVQAVGPSPTPEPSATAAAVAAEAADAARGRYPIWRSPLPEPLEDLIACFGMVCDRLQVPYRPDAMRRWLQRQTLEEYEPFDLYLRIAQALGFNAQVVHFTPTAGGINRLTTPAILRCRDVFTVLHESTPAIAVLGSPRTGLLRFAPAELGQHLTQDASLHRHQVLPTCQAIVLDRFAQPAPGRFGFQWFLPLFQAQRGILVQVLLASLVIQLLGVGNPLLIQQVIDNVIINANHEAMFTFGLLMVVFALLEAGLTILRRYLLASTTNRIDLHLGIEIVRHLLHLPLHFFEKRPVGELSSRLSELEKIRQFLTDTAITVVLDVLFSITYIGVMFLYSVQLTFCVVLTVPIVVISTLIVSNIQRKLIQVRADQGARVQSYLVEVLGGISAVKAQHMESLVEATWRDQYVQYLTSDFTTSTVGTIFYSFTQFLNTASSLVVLWVGAEQVLQGQLTLGGLIAFRILTGYVTGPLLRLAGLWQRFQETALSMDLLADIAEFPAEELTAQKHRLQMPAIQGKVQYQEVSFGFKPGKLQLSAVNLEIAPGTFVGIVGQSGSGKSTLMKLLPRLYTPQSGKIWVDDYDISQVDLSSLRSQIGIVSQEAVLFQGTIRDNIALFEDLSDTDVIEAAQIAEAHDFITQFPDGYNTLVGEKGATLSGGQRQRIAIARVVARNPRLLIFDEATSALDYETERRVCQNLMQRFRNRTCFFITHRLNTIVHADLILFMQSGVLTEQGTHEELMARRQLYYCLYVQQSRQ